MQYRSVLAQFALALFLVILGWFSFPSHRTGESSKQGTARHAAASFALAEKEKGEQRRPLRDDETTPEIVQRAKEILDTNAGAPIGTEVPFEIGDRAYVGRI